VTNPGTAVLPWQDRIGYSDPIITQKAIRSDDPVRNERWILRRKFKDEPFPTRPMSKLPAEGLAGLKQITGHRDGDELSERKAGKCFSRHLAGRWSEGIRLVKTGKSQGGRTEWRTQAKVDGDAFRIMEPL
jgi:hypothetical protein